MERLSQAASRSLTVLWCLAGRGASIPELYSGKHQTTGVNPQVACALAWNIARLFTFLPGSAHDVKAIKETVLFAAAWVETRKVQPWCVRCCNYCCSRGIPSSGMWSFLSPMSFAFLVLLLG